MKDAFDIVTYIKKSLDTLDRYVNGNERPNDIFDCGYADGSWDTLIDLLNQLGVDHKYEKTIEV